ncbi:hypothetical protein [uncultured Flavobacterium sp.]|uniref:hypothetical protein n=1 Tax=uncultured Flavobacterium sp. TaxID=165435 RepID=UPI0030ECD06C|tara:strand:+ start:1150 stop:1608 length:459 start_codon:yes stop_codon:yes gene_type:complete
MKCFHLIFFFICISSFLQNSSKIKIDDVKKEINENNISLDSLGINSNNKLNINEQKIINILNNNDKLIDFNNEKIVFITGSAGRSIVNKQSFFIDFKNRINNNNTLSFSIIHLEAKQKEKSGFDYVITFWVKTFNPNSQKTLKELNKISHKY